MTELQSSEAILNDLFSSFEKNSGQNRAKTEDEDSESNKSLEEKSSEVRSS